jgi:uncharacterized protein YbaP (TraB family)
MPAQEVLHPALWKVSDEDTTIYLFGTIHLLPQGKVWLDGPIAQALEKSDELVTEIPETDVGETQGALLRRGILPSGQSLRDMMSEQERAKFEAAMAGFKLPAGAFDRFKPWYAGVVLATLPLARDGYDVSNGVEAALSNRNKALGHPRSGLETLDFQLSLFDTFPLMVQKRYLFEVIDALPTLDGDVKKIIDEWGKGDPAKLAELMNADEDDPAMVATLLTDRNRTWASWIKARLAKPGTVFIAVGAGHLGGKGSVQDQLAAAGIATTRVQ